VTEHDLAPGGTVTYFMTGPEGERHGGVWRVRAVDPPHALEVEEALAEPDGTPTPDMPTAVMQVALSELDGGGTQMVTTVAWAGDDGWKWMLETRSDAGMSAAAGQIDELLEENP
jgi:uncharacterized protein YndB with AHSA1/START domain